VSQLCTFYISKKPLFTLSVSKTHSFAIQQHGDSISVLLVLKLGRWSYDREVVSSTFGWPTIMLLFFISDFLWTAKPCWCITSTKDDSAFHPSGVG